MLNKFNLGRRLSEIRLLTFTYTPSMNPRLGLLGGKLEWKNLTDFPPSQNMAQGHFIMENLAQIKTCAADL